MMRREDRGSLNEPAARRFGEDFVKLSDNIASLGSGGPIETMAVSSTTAGEGSSTVALHLAMAMAQSREAEILLVDANSRRPALHGLLGMERRKGLTETVLGNLDLPEGLAKLSGPNLSFMDAGWMEAEAGKLLGSDRFRELVGTFRNRFGFVVFDTPPINEYPDAAALSPVVDGVLLVIQAEKVIYEVIEKAREKIRRNGGRIIGAVLNRRRYYIPERIYRKL